MGTPASSHSQPAAPEPADGVSIAAIDRVLTAGFRMLYFPRALEARFEQDTGKTRCRFLMICGLITLALFDLFLIRDYQQIGDAFAQALVFRLGITTPMALIILAVLWRNPAPWLREGMEAALDVFVVAGTLYVVLRSSSPLAEHAHYSLPLVIIFANIIQRLRFWYASAASLLSVILCAAAIPQIEGIVPPVAVGAVLTLSAAAVLTLVGNYNLEHEQRRVYLTGLRDELRSGALSDANRELSAISNLDPLTGLANRRHLEQFLENLWVREAASGLPAAVIMLDIDYFKRFNDHYGHLAGDRCLRTVGTLVQEQLRDGDLAARFGGEEFIVLLPGAVLRDGLRVAERIRRAVETRGIAHQAAPEHRFVTVSLGVASVRPLDVATHHELIAAADAALYHAKGGGRNRVWPSPPSDAPAGPPPDRVAVAG